MKLLFELSNVIIEALLVLYYLQCVYTHIALRKPLIILLFSSYTVILALLSIFPVSAFFRIAYSMLSMLFLCMKQEKNSISQIHKKNCITLCFGKIFSQVIIHESVN